MAEIDPARCPLCGGDNRCGNLHAENDRRCWCVNERFPDKLLAEIPESARDRACICQGCLRRRQSDGAAAASDRGSMLP